MLLIKILAVYLSFEEFFLKWIPVSEQGYLLLRQVPDAVVFLLSLSQVFFLFLFNKRLPISGGKIDVFIFLFVLWSFFCLIINPQADFLIGLANIKSILRYVLLLYIILIINPSEQEVQRLLNWLYAAVIFQALVGFSQFFGGIGVRDILAARSVSEEIAGIGKNFTGNKFETVNDLMGTMGNTINFAYFMLLGLIMTLFRDLYFLNKVCLILVFVILIFLSGSKAVFISSLLLLYWCCLKKIGVGKTVLVTLLALPIVFISAYLMTPDSVRMEMLSSGESLLKGMKNSRLGVMGLISKVVFSFQGVVGFSPDKYYIAEYISKNFPLLPSVFVIVLPRVLEDVYWVALYLYYGVIGLLIWISILFLVFKRIKETFQISGLSGKYISLIAASLVVLSIPLNLLNQAFEVRTFSFYLWLFCGLTVAYRRNLLRKGGEV